MKMGENKIQLEQSWLTRLAREFSQDYMHNLKLFLQREKAQGKMILPRGDQWFAALNATPFEEVKVVILGQDPYPTPGHAHGLCFSVQPGVSLPKSLNNIFQELQDDLGVDNFHSGYLMPWARQGVLLLNAVLTVEAGKTNSHQGKGWEQFTDKIIQLLSDDPKPKIFLLWGAYAQKKGAHINGQVHQIMRSPHPSPLSVYRGFYGSKPFSRINKQLSQWQVPTIDWQLPKLPSEA